MSLKLNQRSICSHKFYTSFSPVHIVGRKDCRLRVLWLVGIQFSLSVACRVPSHSRDQNTGGRLHAATSLTSLPSLSCMCAFLGIGAPLSVFERDPCSQQCFILLHIRLFYFYNYPLEAYCFLGSYRKDMDTHGMRWNVGRTWEKQTEGESNCHILCAI